MKYRIKDIRATLNTRLFGYRVGDIVEMPDGFIYNMDYFEPVYETLNPQTLNQ